MSNTQDPDGSRLAPTHGSPCLWDQAWVGKCRLPSVKNGCCEKHQAVCCSCGAPATHDCEETGQFVCGAPLCDDCEHTIHPEGHNGGIGFNALPLPDGMKSHCKKTEQRFKPWYARDAEANGGLSPAGPCNGPRPEQGLALRRPVDGTQN